MNSFSRSVNLFTESDHLLVRQAMALLPKKELEVITLRFWEGLSETEISIALHTDWRTIEKLMKSALTRLKEICLSRPEFSRKRITPVNFQNRSAVAEQTVVN
jgi:DNA-directed RNA polymerase specialized sigma24 family protein